MAMSRHTSLIMKLVAGAACMFVFTYAMVPLYDTFCRVTGINGKTGGRVRMADTSVDYSRTIRVDFVTQNNQDMPWAFYGRQTYVDVHPGEIVRVMFYAKNVTGEDMVGQSIPSVTPAQSAPYLKKTECFCFNNQPLKAHAEEDMPLVFYIDPALPDDISQMTLSYTLFDITPRTASEKNGANHDEQI
jgi:cytochrome c oxidase assembly protein subunit 11